MSIGGGMSYCRINRVNDVRVSSTRSSLAIDQWPLVGSVGAIVRESSSLTSRFKDWKGDDRARGRGQRACVRKREEHRRRFIDGQLGGTSENLARRIFSLDIGRQFASSRRRKGEHVFSLWVGHGWFRLIL